MTYCRTVTVVQSNSLGLVLKPILSVKVFAPPQPPPQSGGLICYCLFTAPEVSEESAVTGRVSGGTEWGSKLPGFFQWHILALFMCSPCHYCPLLLFLCGLWLVAWPIAYLSVRAACPISWFRLCSLNDSLFWNDVTSLWLLLNSRLCLQLRSSSFILDKFYIILRKRPWKMNFSVNIDFFFVCVESFTPASDLDVCSQFSFRAFKMICHHLLTWQSIISNKMLSSQLIH